MAFATQLSLGVARRSASARVSRAAKPMAKRAHAAMASTLSDFSIDALGGDKPLDLAAAKGKVCLVENGEFVRDSPRARARRTRSRRVGSRARG